jgi:hypothetical protein
MNCGNCNIKFNLSCGKYDCNNDVCHFPPHILICNYKKNNRCYFPFCCYFRCKEKHFCCPLFLYQNDEENIAGCLCLYCKNNTRPYSNYEPVIEGCYSPIFCIEDSKTENILFLPPFCCFRNKKYKSDKFKSEYAYILTLLCCLGTKYIYNENKEPNHFFLLIVYRLVIVYILNILVFM